MFGQRCLANALPFDVALTYHLRCQNSSSRSTKSTQLVTITVTHWHLFNAEAHVGRPDFLLHGVGSVAWCVFDIVLVHRSGFAFGFDGDGTSRSARRGFRRVDDLNRSPLIRVWFDVEVDLNRNEQIFLAFLAPRGIVAAAVVSVFALRILSTSEDEGILKDAQILVPATFMLIVGAVAVYGLGAAPPAQRLGLAEAITVNTVDLDLEPSETQSVLALVKPDSIQQETQSKS